MSWKDKAIKSGVETEEITPEVVTEVTTEEVTEVTPAVNKSEAVTVKAEGPKDKKSSTPAKEKEVAEFPTRSEAREYAAQNGGTVKLHISTVGTNVWKVVE